MFSMIRKLLLATATMWLIGASAHAQTLETEPLAEGRPCASADVVGLWESRVVTGNEPPSALSVVIAHDYRRYPPDGTMMFDGAAKPEADVRKHHKTLDQYDAMDRVTYRAEMVSPGLLILLRDGTPFQGFTCSVVNGPASKPGTILSQLKGMPALKRVQRRLD